MCEKLANNKKINVERHFQTKHTVFAEKYPAGDERIRAVLELLWKSDQSKSTLKRWVKSTNSSTSASFVGAQEIARHGTLFTDGQYIKE